MLKKMLCSAFCLVAILLLGGCWSYHGLNTISLVAGVAIDRAPDSKNYHLSYEIVDLTQSIKESGATGKIIESEGVTIFDAIRNAKKRLVNKLYFGNAQIVIISEDIAKEEDLGSLIDWFLRAAECRENIHIAVSQEKTAADLLKAKGTDQALAAFELNDIIADDPKMTAATRPVELYKLYDQLETPGISPALPAFHNVENDEESVNELNGIAVFKNRRLIGYLSAEDSKYVLFIINRVKGGILPVFISNDRVNSISLEILDSQTKTSFTYQNGQLNMMLDIKVKTSLVEKSEQLNLLDNKQVEELEHIAADQLKEKTLAVIQKVQNKYNADIFGFGRQIYRKDPKLWAQLSNDWDNIFPNLTVEVSANIDIINSALRK